MVEKVSVCTFLWDDPHRQRSYKFDESHVRTLKSMVSRHLHLPHEFCCITDRAEIGDGIRVIPLDDRTHQDGTCGRKLTIWAPDAAERIGRRILSMDLDLVITADITPLIDRPEPTVLFRNPNFSIERRRAFFQGSVQLLNAGSQPQVWDLFFHPHRKNLIGHPGARFGGFEQSWLSETISWDTPHWTHEDGIRGAGRIGDWTDQNVIDELPEGTRIVVFPGNREPSQQHVQEKHSWVAAHYC